MTDIFLPFRDKILVEKIEDENKTKTGLVIPEGSVERPTKGKVIAVGDGRMTDEGDVIPMDIKIGDTVVYPKYSGFPVKLNGEEHLILKQDEILGFLNGDNNVN